MLSNLLYFSAILISAHGAGKFSVLTYPPSITFKGHDHIMQSSVPEVYSVGVGFTPEKESNWQGMYLSYPWNLSKMIVTVAIEGTKDTDLREGHHYPMITNEDGLKQVYEVMAERIQAHYPNEQNDILIDCSNGPAKVSFLDIKDIRPTMPAYNALNSSIEEDNQLLNELAYMNGLSESINESTLRKRHAPQLIWIQVQGLHAVSDLHGENSTQTNEAKDLTNSVIHKLNAACRKLYDRSVFFNVLTSDTSHTRRMRRAATQDDPKPEDINLAQNYSGDYPVIFNIILWFGVTMFFSLLAICMFIGNMDPGRDSIIYRMTSTRMKKDN